MKNILITVGLTLLLTSFSEEKIKITVCEKAANAITIQHLIDCKTLGVSDENYKVISFTIGVPHGKDYFEAKMTNNEVLGKILDLIIQHKPESVYIENIVVINKNGQKTTIDKIKINK